MTQHYHFTWWYGVASNEELKKCPCCGGKASIRQDYLGRWRVQCDGCGKRTLSYVKSGDAIEVWNRLNNCSED